MLNNRPTHDAPYTGEPAQPIDARGGREPVVVRTRRSPYTAIVNLIVALALVALTLAFIAQNGTKVQFEFLWMDFTMAVGLAMLVGAVTGAVIALLIATGLVVHARRRR